MAIKDFIARIKTKKERKIKEEDIKIFPFDDGKGKIELRILILVKEEKFKDDEDFVYKTILHYKDIGNRQEMSRTLKSAPGGERVFTEQEAPEGYDLHDSKTLSAYFSRGEIKESYTLAELLSKQRIINFEGNYKSPCAGDTERE